MCLTQNLSLHIERSFSLNLFWTLLYKSKDGTTVNKDLDSGGIPIWFVSVLENPKLHFVAMDAGRTLWNANIPRKDLMSF